VHDLTTARTQGIIDALKEVALRDGMIRSHHASFSCRHMAAPMISGLVGGILGLRVGPHCIAAQSEDKST
jgi:hypothetical protein